MSLVIRTVNFTQSSVLNLSIKKNVSKFKPNQNSCYFIVVLKRVYEFQNWQCFSPRNERLNSKTYSADMRNWIKLHIWYMCLGCWINWMFIRKGIIYPSHIHATKLNIFILKWTYGYQTKRKEGIHASASGCSPSREQKWQKLECRHNLKNVSIFSQFERRFIEVFSGYSKQSLPFGQICLHIWCCCSARNCTRKMFLSDKWHSPQIRISFLLATISVLGSWALELSITCKHFF
jgi:hypothetical protein